MLQSVSSFIKRGRTVVPDKYRNKKVVFFIALVGLTMDNLNITGALTTSFSMEEKFHASSNTISWALSAYALTLGSFIILFGKLGDILGPHNTFIIGEAIMSLFSLLTAIPQPSIIALIVFRAFQGLGGAVLMPSGFALAANYFQGKELEMAISWLTIVLTASFGLGTVLGGAFSITNIGYQGFFYFTFAISATCATLLYFLIIPIEQTEAHKNMRVKDLDFPGVSFLVIGLLLVIFGLTEAGITWNSPKVYVPIPIGAVLIIATILFESIFLSWYKRSHTHKVTRDLEVEGAKMKKDASLASSIDSVDSIESTDRSNWFMRVQLIFPKEVFQITNFPWLAFGVFSSYFTFVFIVSSLIQYTIFVEFNSPLLASVKILPMAVGTVLGSAIYKGKYALKVGIRNTIMLSVAVTLGSIIWISRTDYKVKNEYWIYQFVPLFLLGYAINLYFMVYLNAIMSQTPLHLQGLVSGIFQTFGQVAVAIGSALLSTILGVLEYHRDDPAALEDQYKKFHNSFYAAIAISGLFLILTLFIKDPYKGKETKEGERS
ncbi:DEKNAAC103660 [Brettanomyces naardenensis]|uniref:DEKNAAC103660 n=1 Tax=Brettanomyces naardenensis TaxID=13370 RepID=A0A448YNY9_BRENA|nr:DEKNAAC103660 [Brettanomyces naardenensis]